MEKSVGLFYALIAFILFGWVLLLLLPFYYVYGVITKKYYNPFKNPFTKTPRERQKADKAAKKYIEDGYREQQKFRFPSEDYRRPGARHEWRS